MLDHSALSVASLDGYCYHHSYFADKETDAETERVTHFTTVTQLISSGART